MRRSRSSLSSGAVGKIYFGLRVISDIFVKGIVDSNHCIDTIIHGRWEYAAGGGGDVRPPRTPATNASADKLAELIDWTEGLRSADTQCSPSTQSLGLRD